MPKIKNYVLALPTILFATSFLLVILVLASNYFFYRNSASVFLSTVQISTEYFGSGKIGLNFNFANQDKQNFEKIFDSFGIKDLEDRLTVKVNQKLADLLISFKDQLVYLKPGSNSLLINTELPFSGESKKIWNLASFLPEDTSFYLQSKNNLLGLPKNMEPFFIDSVWAVFPTAETYSSAWIRSVTDPKSINAEIKTIISTANEASAESSLNQITFERVVVNKINSEGKTFYLGAVDNLLILTSSEEGFRSLLMVKNKSKNALSVNKYYAAGKSLLPESGGFALYLGGSKLRSLNSENSILANVLTDYGLDNSDLSSILEKINSLSLVITSSNKLVGMVNFK